MFFDIARLMGAGHKYFFAVAQKFRYPGSRFCLLTKHRSACQRPTKCLTDISSSRTKRKNCQTHEDLAIFGFARLMGADPTASHVTGGCSTVELQPHPTIIHKTA